MAYHDTSQRTTILKCMLILDQIYVTIGWFLIACDLRPANSQIPGNKMQTPGQPVAYPPLHGHRGSVYINRSYEKAEAREDPAHKVEKNLVKVW